VQICIPPGMDMSCISCTEGWLLLDRLANLQLWSGVDHFFNALQQCSYYAVAHRSMFRACVLLCNAQTSVERQPG